MDSLLERIKASFKWKKTAEYCAERLGISLADYVVLKEVVKNRDTFDSGSTSYEIDLEKGEAKMETLSSSEPKSPEEIIKILNIDTTQWKLSS